MNRTIIVVVAASGLLLQDAVGHEVRHSTFPTALIGSWAETTEHCATKDKSNISIESAKYGDARALSDRIESIGIPKSGQI